MTNYTIVQCPSCEGYGWFNDEFDDSVVDCDWCNGTGYVYRDENNIDHRIPPEDYGKVAEILENLEQNRLQDMGYSGQAKHPNEQEVRQNNTDQSPENKSDPSQ